MSEFKESALYKAMTKSDCKASDVTEALGSATTNACLRDVNGDTYLHVAAEKLNSVTGTDQEKEAILCALMAKCSVFIRNCGGYTVLDKLAANVPVSQLKGALKAHMKALLKQSEDKLVEFFESAVMSGKLSFIGVLATSIRKELAGCNIPELMERLSQMEEEIRGKQEAVRNNENLREVMTMSKRAEALIPDLAGLPALIIAVVHGHSKVVEYILEKFPETINCVDNMGRTAMHYAESLTKNEASDAIRAALITAKADESIKDLCGNDVSAVKATHIDMEKFLADYKTILDRNLGEDLLYRLHAAILTGNLRAVKMTLERRELATKPDVSKLTPLHKSIILKSNDITDYLVAQFPAALNVQGMLGLSPVHFAAVVNPDLYERLQKAGGDITCIDTEGNSPEYYKGHPNDFPVDVDTLKAEMFITPVSRPVSAASQRAASAKSTKSKPSSATAKPGAPSGADAGAAAPVVSRPIAPKKKKAADPETLDAKYIAEVLGTPLTAALAEVAEKRPWDPIEYLAQWLYKHKANLDFDQRQIDAVREAEEAEKRKIEEAESRARRRREAILLKEKEEEEKKRKEEEARKQKEQEELQRKAKESVHLSQPPELATVTEDNEETEAPPVPQVVSPRVVVEKDKETAQTELHKLVVSGSVEEVKTLLGTSGVDLLPERDSQNKNARDLAESEEMKAALDEYVLDLFKNEDFTSISKLMENGYPVGELSAGVEGEGFSETAKDTMATASQLQTTLHQVAKCVRGGELRSVKQAINKKAQAVSRLTAQGFTALHLAVLYQKAEIVEYLVKEFPGTVLCRDNMNRTPLHIAQGVEEPDAAIIALLTSANAESSAVDCNGVSTEQYSECAEQVAELKTRIDELLDTIPDPEPQTQEEETAPPTEQSAEQPAEQPAE